MARGLVVLILVAALCGLCLVDWPAASADEVVVKVIEPDKPGDPAKPDQPKPGDVVRPARPGGAPAAEGLRSGDWVLDRVLGRLGLSDEQKAKLAPILEEAAKELKTAGDEHAAKAGEVTTKLREAWEASRKAGGTFPASQPEITALSERSMELFRENEARKKQWREQLLAKVSPLLTEEQARKLKEAEEEWSTDPAVMGRRMARGTLRFMTEGIELTDQQRDQAMEILQKRQEETRKRFEEASTVFRALGERAMKGDAEARKELQEQSARAFSAWQEDSRATRQALEEVLTPEQRTKSAELRRSRSEQWAKSTIDWTVRSFERAELTESQKQKATELADAAREAAGKLDADDWRARQELTQRLREDIRALLTDEQKEKVRDSQSFWGGPRGRMSRPGSDDRPEGPKAE